MVLPCSKFETLLHNYPSRRVAISLGSGSGIRVAFTEAQRSISEEIYEKMSTELKLKASDVAGVQEFGSAVAVSRDYTIVGARHDGFDPGAAYVFEKNGAAWVEQAKLSASDTTGFDHFGAAVGMDDDYAIIGASQGGIGSRGQAYIFHRNGSDWVEDTILFANGETDDALFGQSVSISGDCAIVGSD